MKKLLIIGLLLFTIGIYFTSCDSEEVTFDNSDDKVLVTEDQDVLTVDSSILKLDDDEITEDDPDGGIGDVGTELCKKYDASILKYHIVKNVGYGKYDCFLSSSYYGGTVHRKGMTVTIARNHCSTFQ